MNARDAFRKTVSGLAAERPVFLPIVYRLAARIDQTPVMDMSADATAYANALEGAYKLLHQDAIVTSFDDTIEKELFGAEVDWPDEYGPAAVTGWSACDFTRVSPENSWRFSALLDAVQRLVQTRGRETAIVGVVTGPCSLGLELSEHARPEKEYGHDEIVAAAGTLLGKIVRAYGEAKVDALIIREDPAGARFFTELAAREKIYRDAYATLFNLLRFYNVAGLLMVKHARTGDLPDTIEKLRPNGLILDSQELCGQDLTALAEMSRKQKLAIGLPVPLTNPEAASARLQICQGFLAANPTPGFFYVSDGEVPPDVPLELLNDISTRITSGAES